MRLQPRFAALLGLALLATACAEPGLGDANDLEGATDDQPVAGPSRVYFLDGFYVHLSVDSLNRAIGQLREHLAENHPGVELIEQHNSTWDSICEDLTALEPSAYPDRLVLIGHSFGAWASVKIANCLGERPIDLIVTIDTVDKLLTSPGDIIPDNVFENHNFYEDQSLLSGKQDNRRSDGSYLNITNTHIEVDSLPAHYKIVNHIVDDGTIQRLLDSALAPEP